MDLEIFFDPGRLFTFHLHLNLMLRNDFEKRLSPLLQIKKGDGQEMWRQDEKERLLSDVSFLFCLRFILLFVFYFNLSPSSSFPYLPPLLSPSSSSLVSGPSVTLTSTTGDHPAVFGPPAFLVYFCLFHTLCLCMCLRSMDSIQA